MKFRIFSWVFIFFSIFASVALSLLLFFIFDSSNPLFAFVWGLGNYAFVLVVFYFICRSVICSARKKHNITDGCIFWDCPHYDCCPYNSNK